MGILGNPGKEVRDGFYKQIGAGIAIGLGALSILVGSQAVEFVRPKADTWTAAAPFRDFKEIAPSASNPSAPKGLSYYPDMYVDVYPDSYDFYPLVPKRKKRSSGEVWGEYSLVSADRGYSFDYSYPMRPKKPQANNSSDSYTGYIYPEFIDTFTPLTKKVPAPSSVIGAPAGDRT